MLKKILFFIYIFSYFTVKAEVDFRISGFVPQDRLFREIYGNINPAYQLEFSYNIHDRTYLWSNITYLSISGQSIPLNFKSKLKLIPINFGVSYIYYQNNFLDAYLGAGLNWAWLQEKSNCFPEFDNRANNIGSVIKFGVFHNHNCVRFTLFADYIFQKFSINKFCNISKINSSGLFCGIGIGIIF